MSYITTLQSAMHKHVNKINVCLTVGTQLKNMANLCSCSELDIPCACIGNCFFYEVHFAFQRFFCAGSSETVLMIGIKTIEPFCWPFSVPAVVVSTLQSFKMFANL